MDTEHRASVVVLTHNRRDQLLQTLQRLRALPERPPVIVVDNASSDGTAHAVRTQHAGVTLVRTQRNLGAAARNLGVRAAATRYVAFCDDDVYWHAGALDQACDVLDAHPRVAVLNARLLVGERGAPDPVTQAMAASPLDSHGLPGRCVAGFLAGACVMRADAFREAGGYREELFIGGEEELLAIDLLARGWVLLYAPSVVAQHLPSPLRDGVRRRALLARNAVWVAWMRYPVHEALARTLRELGRCGAGRARMAWLRETLSGLRWAWSQRRPMPPGVAEQLRRVRRHAVH
jgi:GT2 family glycosyltransferase